MNADKLSSLGIKLPRKNGQVKVTCPQCSHTRKPQNKKEPCLSVNIDEGIYNCHNCGWQGSVSAKKYELPEWDYSHDVVPESKCMDYLTQDRGLSRLTLSDFNIRQEKQYIPKEGAEVDCIQFPYFKNGIVVNIKYRSLGKGFRMVSNAELTMFNIDCINLEETKESVIITEGEIDAMSFYEAGFDNVISVPNGASKGNNNLQYIDSSALHLEKVEKFYLALDKDEAGTQLENEISRRLGKDKCWIVDFPDGCKDANQVLLEHGYKALQEAIKNARPMPIEGVVKANDCRESVYELYRNGVDRGDMLDVQGFDDLLSFKTSMLYIITGIPTHGKSSVCNWMECLLAARSGWKFAIFSPEHYPLDYLIYRYAEILIGKGFFHNAERRMDEHELGLALDFINEHFFFIRPTEGMYTMAELLEIAKSLVLRHGVKGFTIDPWNTIKHDYNSGLTETQYIEVALNELTIFKQVHDVGVFLVAHPRKMGKIKDVSHPMHGLHEIPTLYDISGSKSFYDKADVGITVYRNFNTKQTTVYVQKVKFKHLGEVGMQNFKYEGCSRYSPTNEVQDYLDYRDRTPAPYIRTPLPQTAINRNWFDDKEDRVDQFEEEIDMPF